MTSDSPILVRLDTPVGQLPTGSTYLLPEWLSYALIRLKLATPVADLATYADIVISDDEIETLSLDWDLIKALAASRQ